MASDDENLRDKMSQSSINNLLIVVTMKGHLDDEHSLLKDAAMVDGKFPHAQDFKS